MAFQNVASLLAATESTKAKRDCSRVVGCFFVSTGTACADSTNSTNDLDYRNRTGA